MPVEPMSVTTFNVSAIALYFELCLVYFRPRLSLFALSSFCLFLRFAPIVQMTFAAIVFFAYLVH